MIPLVDGTVIYYRTHTAKGDVLDQVADLGLSPLTCFTVYASSYLRHWEIKDETETLATIETIARELATFHENWHLARLYLTRSNDFVIVTGHPEIAQRAIDHNYITINIGGEK